MTIPTTDLDIGTRYALQEDFNNGFVGRDRQVVIQTDDPKGYRPVIMDGTTQGGKSKVALVADLSDYVSVSTYNSDKAGFETTANASATYATKTALSSGLANKLDKSTYTTDKATFLTKTDASNTYLGKTAKAESAKVADSANSVEGVNVTGTVDNATKAAQDSLGNVIHETYALKSESSSISLLDVYPVGSIYLSILDTSPESLFGGTWEKLQNVFLYGSGTKSLGATGGSETVTLTTNQIPSHTHTGSASSVGTHTHGSSKAIEVTSPSEGVYWETPIAHRNYRVIERTPDGAHSHTLNLNNTGGGQSHNNMPPYLVVNMWKRTA